MKPNTKKRADPFRIKPFPVLPFNAYSNPQGVPFNVNAAGFPLVPL